MRTGTSTAGRTLVGVGTMLGAAGLAYSAGFEVRAYTLRRIDLPILPPGAEPLRVLHITDMHLTPGQGKKLAWLNSLADLKPDLVVNTGDNIAHMRSVSPLLDALDDLLDIPGVFVFGSNDYFSPSTRNPVKYLLPDDGTRRTDTPQLPWPELRDAFQERGWLNLNNRFGSLTVGGVRFAFAGVDDPHLEYDDLASVSGPADPTADVRVAVAHAPYLRVLDAFAKDGYDAIFAGHTHGGQLCLPFRGALVTNCDLEPARAKGLHRHPAGASLTDPGTSWLHVSAGLGTSPFAPLRFCCRPEATLLTLTPREPVSR